VSRSLVYFSLLLILLTACAPTIKRIVLIVDGERRVFDTQAITVEDVLREQNVELGENDRVDPPIFAEAGRSATITVVRVQSQTEEISQQIPFTRQIVRDESFPDNQMRVLALGANGAVSITYSITLEDGKEASRRESARQILAQPKDEVLAIGTQGSIASVPISGTLAYISYRNAWVMRQESGEKRPLTSNGDLDGRVFSLSADGRYLLFSRAEENKFNSLWVVDTLVVGETPRALNVSDVMWAQLSPDARALAYSTGEKTEGAPGWKAHNDLWVAATVLGDGNASLKPANAVWKPSIPAPYAWWGANFAWSPNNRTIAYAFANEIGFVDSADRATDENRTPRRTLKTFAPFRTRADWVWTPQVAWSADGKFIVGVVHAPLGNPRVASDDPTFEVWAFGVNGAVSAPLARQTGMWASPVWSPANALGESRIAFGIALAPSDSERSRYALGVMDRDGGNRRQIFPFPGDPGLVVVQLTWAPNANQLAAVRDGDVWLFDFAANRWAQLTANGASSLPRWAR
jgi:resuscitation-promoting factor RpfB